MNDRMMRCCLLLCLLPGITAAALRSPGQIIPGAVSAKAVTARDELVLSLSDAIALALRDNRSIRSAYLQRIADKFELRVAVDRYAPQLSFKAQYQANRNQDDRYRQAELTPSASVVTAYGTRVSLDWAYGQTRGNAAGPRYRDGANLMLIQPLLRGAGRDIAMAPLHQAELAEQANRLALKDQVSHTITSIIGLYRDLLRAQEQLNITDDARQRASQLIAVNRELIDAGRMAAFEIVQAEAELANQELALEGSRNNLHAGRLALLQALALDLDTPLRVSEEAEAEPTGLDPRRALAQAEALQPIYLLQLLADQQADLDLRLAKDQQRWDLSLIGATSQARERPSSGKVWEHYLGLQLEIPIADLSRRQGLVRAQVAVDSRRLQLADARQQLQREVVDGVREVQVSWRQLQIAGRALDLSRRKLAIEQEELALGLSSNFQVLSFESDLRGAQSARLDAQIAYLNAQTALDLILGTTLDSWDVAIND